MVSLIPTGNARVPQMFHAPTPSGQNEQSKKNEQNEQTERREQARHRDPFFDNAKYLAILLVAIGHSWEPLKGDNRVLQGLYMVVYSFHMPAFIIISGYFSRSFDLRPDRLKRLITGVAVPYVVFEIAYSLFSRYANDDPHQKITLLDPLYLTWFLCALFIWRLTTPIWKLVRHPLPFALGIAMLASCTPDMTDDFDLQRLAQFLPYFVLGLVLRPEHFRWVRRRAVRVLSVPVFAGAALFGWWAVPRMNAGWFYHHDSAQEFGAPWWAGPVMTLLMFGCSLLLTAGFYSWVPSRKTWFTALGAGTLYGYLLHGFLVKGAGYAGLFHHAWLHRPYGVLLVSALAATAVTLLCTPPVRRVFRFAVEPRMEWAFRRDAAELARDRAQFAQPVVREKVNA